MAWTDPSSHVWTTGEVLSAANMNTYIKDDLIDLNRRATTTTATVATSQTTTSDTFADLGTAGPAVTVTTGTVALVVLYCACLNDTTLKGTDMGYAVSGATTIAAASAAGDFAPSPNATAGANTDAGVSVPQASLTAGSNTFTAKYMRTGTGGTATFAGRIIAVRPN